MIRIFRETEGRQHQGINNGQVMNRNTGRPFSQHPKIVVDQVVPEEAVGVGSQVRKRARERCQRALPGERECPLVQHCPDLEDFAGMRNLKIEQEGPS